MPDLKHDVIAKRWAALIKERIDRQQQRQLADGEVPLDNNATESTLRGSCIRKHNWRLIDTIRGQGGNAYAKERSEKVLPPVLASETCF